MLRIIKFQKFFCVVHEIFILFIVLSVKKEGKKFEFDSWYFAYKDSLKGES